MEMLYIYGVYYISWHRLCELADITQVEFGVRAICPNQRTWKICLKANVPAHF